MFLFDCGTYHRSVRARPHRFVSSLGRHGGGPRHELEELRGRFAILEAHYDALYGDALCVVVLTRTPGGAAVERLRSVLPQVRRAVQFGMHRGVAVALMAAHLQSGRDLREVAPGIPNTVPEEEWEELA